MILNLRYIAIVLLTVCGIAVAQARVIHVPAEAETISAGVDVAVKGDTILVADGVYSGDGNHDIGLFARSIVLKSANGPEAAIIDCSQDSPGDCRGFVLSSREDTTTIVDGFTIRGGHVNFRGGAVLIEDSSPMFKNCHFENNSAHHGGALYITFDAAPVFEHCRFIGNSAGDVGGAVLTRFGASAVFRHCTFENNTAVNGVFLCYNASPSISDCVFNDNHCDSTGGAVFLQDNSSPSFTDCRFAGNTCAGRGGAIFIEERGKAGGVCAPVFSRCFITGNGAATGGGVYIAGVVRAAFDRCTIARNRADDGAALMCGGDAFPEPTFSNCIIVFQEGGRTVSGACDRVRFTGTDIFGNEAGDWIGDIGPFADQEGNFSLDPGFCDDREFPFSINAQSPCAPDFNIRGYHVGAGEIGCSAVIGD